MYTEYLSVLEEERCPRQLYPLTLGPPTRHVQTRNKFVSITTGVTDTLCLRVWGWGVGQPGRLAWQRHWGSPAKPSSWRSPTWRANYYCHGNHNLIVIRLMTSDENRSCFCTVVPRFLSGDYWSLLEFTIGFTRDSWRLLEY